MGGFRGVLIRVLLRMYPRSYRRVHLDELERTYCDVLGAGTGRLTVRRSIWLLWDALATSLRVRAHGFGATGSDGRGRRGAGMEAARQELVYGLRSLGRSPGFALVAVLTIGIGIGANVAIFTIVQAVLLKPLPWAGADRIVTIENRYLPEGATGWISAAEFTEYEANDGALEQAVPLTPENVNLTGLPRPLRLQGLAVGAGYFELLGERPAVGRAFTAEDGLPGAEDVVVLSHGLWQAAFGGEAGIIGRTVLLDGRGYTVVGVMGADHAPFSDYAFPGRFEQFWLPVRMDPAIFTARTVERHNLLGLARLAPGRTVEDAERLMVAAVRRLERKYPGISNAGSRDVALVPLRRRVAGDSATALLLLSAAVMLVLLVACVNVANFLLARADSRAAEAAVRAALGADRTRMFWYGLSESLVIGVAGGILGLGIVLPGRGMLSALLPSALPLPGGLRVGLPVLGFTLVLSVAAGVVAGALPALRTAREGVYAPIRRGSGGIGGGSRWGRGMLVVVQVAGAVVLVASAALLVRSLAALRAVDPGFDPAGRYVMNISASRTSYPDARSVADLYGSLLRVLEEVPGVESVAASWQTPQQTAMSDWPVIGHEATAQEWVSADPNLVSPGFFETYGIRLVGGRVFDRRDIGRTPGVVVLSSTSARRLWGDESAVGRLVNFDFNEPVWREVIGVVEDVRGRSLADVPRAQTYMTFGEGPWSRNPSLALTLKSRSAAAVLRHQVQDAILAIDPDIPAGPIVSLDAQVARTIERERLVSALLAAFASIALVLGAIGVYGLIAYSVNRRRREIGLRIAIGARPIGVVGLVVRQGAALGVAGIALGLAGALVSGRLLAGFLYGVEPGDRVTLLAVAMAVLGVVLVASWLPARRAATVDPLVAIRE